MGSIGQGVAALVLAAALASPSVAVEAPSSLRGAWSPDLSCDAAAPRHVIGRTTLEWREGGERRALAEVRFRVLGNEITASVREVTAGDALRPGDVVHYLRVAGGIRPLRIERNGTVIDISAARTFYACRS